MRLVVKPENILEAIALQTRKDLQPFLLGMLGMGVSQVLLTHPRPRMDGDELIRSPVFQLLRQLLQYAQSGQLSVLKWAKLDPQPKRLLDVAGGPAEYSIALCQQYPQLQADILDLPNAVRTRQAKN
jgi:hypothetical protein